MNKYKIYNNTYNGLPVKADSIKLVEHSIVLYDEKGEMTYIFPAATTTVIRD